MADQAKLDLELSAFIAWITTFTVSRGVNSISDLSDGTPLLDILAYV